MKNRNVLFKLTFIMALPILGLIFFAAIEVNGRFNQFAKAANLIELAEFAIIMSNLVHSQQNERSATAVFLGSGGQTFAEELPGIRDQNDSKLSILKGFLEDFDAQARGEEFFSAFNNTMALFNNTQQIRADVDGQKIYLADVVNHFSQINEGMLELISFMGGIADDPESSRAIQAYANFLQGKEGAGSERALLSNTFELDEFQTGHFSELATLISRQDTYFKVFNRLATPEIRDIFKKAKSDQSFEEVVVMRKVAYELQAEGEFDTEATVWYDAITTKIEILKTIEDQLSADLKANATKARNDAMAALIFEVFGSVLLIATSLLLGMVVSRNIASALKRQVDMIDELNSGNLSHRMSLDQRDEFGKMAKAMDKFAESMEKEIITAFERLAEGDLTFKVEGIIKEPLAHANESLNAFMTEIRSASHEVASAAGLLFESSQKLSTGSTEQAAALEEITVSMQHLNIQTNLNADNSQLASSIASSTRDHAEAGQTRMSEMVGAMSQINESSKNIAKIIKVIDEIAFQTNLLALNAAVEAARAGQFGKGFAVVAEEVRNLAERSAGAAKETTKMIEESIGKVQRGSRIADDTNKALGEIVQGVSKTTDLINEIAGSSLEQARGIAEIGKGLEQLNKVTQLNAGIATESAYSSTVLRDQSEIFRTMVGRFTLEGTRRLSD